MQRAVEAMSLLRNREHGTALARCFIEAPLHTKWRCNRRAELCIELRQSGRTCAVIVEHRSHEGRVRRWIVEMLSFSDQAVIRGQKTCNCRNDPRRVRARDRQNRTGRLAA